MSTTTVTKPARAPQPQTRSPKLGERRTPQQPNARSATKQDDSPDTDSATEMIPKDEYLRTIDRLEAQAKAMYYLFPLPILSSTDTTLPATPTASPAPSTATSPEPTMN